MAIFRVLPEWLAIPLRWWGLCLTVGWRGVEAGRVVRAWYGRDQFLAHLSYTQDHFLSVVRPCVCPSVNIFKRLLIWSSQFCSNSIWSFLRLGEWNIAKMIAIRWLRLPPCPYMVKTFKNLLQNRGLGLDLCFIIGNGRSTKVAKMMIVNWRLTFLRRGQVCIPVRLYRPHTFVWENIEIFKRPPLKPLGQCCSTFKRSLLWAGELKMAKIVAVHWPRWPPCPYMLKPLKIFSPRSK